jgi:hypothetical protein
VAKTAEMTNPVGVDELGGLWSAGGIQRVEISDSVVTLEPNKFYVFPEMSTLSITLGGEANDAIVQEYKFRFISGNTATTLEIPSYVKGAFSVSANSVVEVSIFDNYAVSQSWPVEPGLPSEYTACRYLESTGTQYIRTDYVWKNDNAPYKVSCTFQLTSIPSKKESIFGSDESMGGIDSAFVLTTDVNLGKFNFMRIGASVTDGLRFGKLDTDIHTFEFVFGEGIYFDGELLDDTIGATQPMGTKDNGSPFGLFATGIRYSQLPVKDFARCRIMRFELYGSDDKKIMVPCYRNQDRVYGMYDLNNHEFYTNSGTGEFIGG